MYMEQLAQALALMDQVTAISQAAGTLNTGGIDMSKVKRALYDINIGAVTGSITATVQSAATAAFTTPHTVSGPTAALTANSHVKIDIRAEAIQQLNPGDRFVRLSLVIVTGPVLLAVSGFGGEAEQKPANQYDLAAVSLTIAI